MKSSRFSVVVLCGSLILSMTPAVSHAKDTRRRSAPVAPTESVTAPVQQSGYSSPNRYGLGLSTLGGIVSSNTSLTGIMQLSGGDMIQALAAIDHTHGNFQFGVGGLYKHTLVERQGNGFHIGGGLGLGNAPKYNGEGMGFALGLTALAGLHFAIPGLPEVVAHLDGGPLLTVIDGTTDFSLKALSAALGLSVAYMF